MDQKEIKRAFQTHKNNARTRGILFLLTFEEWVQIWQQSGHLGEWGKFKGQYNMARFGDAGPYAIGNVKIILCEENHKEMRHKLSTKDKMKRERTGSGNSNFGNSWSNTQRQKMFGNSRVLGKKHDGSKKVGNQNWKFSRSSFNKWHSPLVVELVGTKAKRFAADLVDEFGNWNIF